MNHHRASRFSRTLERCTLALFVFALHVPLTGISACDPNDGDGDGWLPEDGDCDDAHAETYPGALEICDARDNDCDGAADEGLSCAGIIGTVAGQPRVEGFTSDGAPAHTASLASPTSVAAAADGSYYIAESGADRIRRVNPAGVLETVVGIGTEGFSGDGGPATEAQLRNPLHVVFDHQGRMLISDVSNHRIRRVDTRGIITTVAGNGTAGLSGDGGPATEAALNTPISVAALPDGSFYLADVNNDRIRYVSVTGIITTFAGSMQDQPFNGDGLPATETVLNAPSSLAVDSDGVLYFADLGFNRIRKVENGIVETVAGTGDKGYYGDGVPATEAVLNWPQGVTVDGGTVFFTEYEGQRVRRIDPDGLIFDVAGTGRPGYSGDGGPATEARVDTPYNLSVDRNGDLLIADTGNEIVRLVYRDW